jgi:phosphopantothenoylcysteine decarboxylase/phosphopantothenate--cysteine ligase
MLWGKRILLVITGGIAAYKCLFLIRRLRDRGAAVRPVLTAAGAEFVTPLSVAALAQDKVYQELFSLTDESTMGHIRLSRETDLVVVAPATADFLAKMAQGRADDLASAVLLATDKPVLAAPAMNVFMWRHPATQENVRLLAARGVRFVGPNEGELADGETGPGRMAEPEDILATIEAYFGSEAPLSGRRALVTSGPTHEALDPVRYIANRSSGKQGHAISLALARMGAETTLVSGPTVEPDPPGVQVVKIVTAEEMLAACLRVLPVDVAVCAAAVSDWRPARRAAHKIKKNQGPLPRIELEANPDVLAAIAAAGNLRPRLVVGFAAETENVVENARKKREAKDCDWIVANDVSSDNGVFGGETNTVHLIRREGTEDWPTLAKSEVAERLARRIADHFAAASS